VNGAGKHSIEIGTEYKYREYKGQSLAANRKQKRIVILAVGGE